MSEEDYSTLMTILPYYKEHLDNHPNSLLSKIYGLFTITTSINKNIYKYNIYMQRNLKQVDKVFGSRSYDLKGSQFKRQVYKTYNDIQPFQSIPKTLKDVDFIALEKQLNINNKIKASFVQALKDDSNFFTSRNILDYSMLIIIVDHDGYINHLKKTAQFQRLLHFEKMRNNPQNQLVIIPITNRPGFYYHIGIIDYL